MTSHATPMRFAATTGLAVLAAALMISLDHSVVSAQFNDRQMALNRCEQELQYRMSREVGGRSPDAAVNERRAQVSQGGNNQVTIRGDGRFSRDSNDRGREFTFDCTVNMRSGNVKANYQWRGPGYGGQYPDPGYDDNRPGFGRGGGYQPNGRVYFSGGIVNRNSGKCLDVEGRSGRDAANVQQWTCSGGSNQLWDIIDLGRGQYSIVSQGSNKVLDVAGDGERDGANIQQYRWHGGDNQRWRIERVGNGAFQIVSMSSGRCLDVEGARRDDGANVQLWRCSGGANQAFTFRK